MPRISSFYGIVIAITTATITLRTSHAIYADYEAQIVSSFGVDFDDGSVREIDLEAELWGPVFEPLRHDPQLFRQVRVDDEAGTIVSPNGADLDPDVLHGHARPAPRG